MAFKFHTQDLEPGLLPTRQRLELLAGMGCQAVTTERFHGLHFFGDSFPHDVQGFAAKEIWPVIDLAERADRGARAKSNGAFVGLDFASERSE